MQTVFYLHFIQTGYTSKYNDYNQSMRSDSFIPSSRYLVLAPVVYNKL